MKPDVGRTAESYVPEKVRERAVRCETCGGPKLGRWKEVCPNCTDGYQPCTRCGGMRRILTKRNDVRSHWRVPCPACMVDGKPCGLELESKA